LAIVVTAIVVAGGCNAINIIDGFNGLSGSAVVIMAAGLMAVALKSGDAYIAMNGALCIGATLGFMLLNYPAGRLFLGDGGAYYLGFWLAEMAVLLLVRNPAVSAWQVLAICAYPIIEVLFSVYRRKFIKKVSPGAPDALHLHALIFRRLVFKHVRADSSRPWKRNAAVAFVMAPVIAICVYVSVQFGASTPVSIAIVIAQLAIYIAIYGRLVRGKWTRSGLGFTISDGDAKTGLR
jgi:UDP-N-acetylmuramyl pentapeptide phosphotransferase/UDP-N-acetylglucosamine-1-phosphate transferase